MNRVKRLKKRPFCWNHRMVSCFFQFLSWLYDHSCWWQVVGKPLGLNVVFPPAAKNQATQQNGDIFGSACGRTHIDWRAAISWTNHVLNFISGQRWCFSWTGIDLQHCVECVQTCKNIMYTSYMLNAKLNHPYPNDAFSTKKSCFFAFFFTSLEPWSPTFKSPKPWTLFQPQAGTSIGVYLNVHYIAIVYYTLPETNSSHLKIGHPKGNVFKSSKSSFVLQVLW